jgi:hypothetical protein
VSDLAAGLLAALGAGPLTTGELARSVDRRRADVLAALQELQAAGDVERLLAPAYHAPNRTVWQRVASDTARNTQGTAAEATAAVVEGQTLPGLAEASGVFLLRGKETGQAIRDMLASGVGASEEEREQMRLAAQVDAIMPRWPKPPPLTMRQALDGVGGEDRQAAFWRDFGTLSLRSERIRAARAAGAEA